MRLNLKLKPDVSGHGPLDFQSRGVEVDREGHFVGCPLEAFERTARDPFLVTLLEGLVPWDKVVEIGAGCLRTGYWFLNYLEACSYHAIEPNETMFDAGIRHVSGEYLWGRSAARYSASDRFEVPPEWGQFDFFVSFSTWSHAPKVMISKMLDFFVERSRPSAKFVTSYFPTVDPSRDYGGHEWVGRSHESDVPGTVAHLREWVEQACHLRGLTVRDAVLPLRITRPNAGAKLIPFTSMGQQWIVIERITTEEEDGDVRDEAEE